MIKCLVLGGYGMLGHMVVKYMKTLSDFEVSFTSRDETTIKGIYFDAYDLEKLTSVMDVIKPDLVVNCIGIINSLVKDNKEEVVYLNSYLPHKLAQICKDKDSKLIHISTDCVFSGISGGKYHEHSLVSPVCFYGLSKATGEVIDPLHLTIRTSIIGPELGESKKGLMDWFLNQTGRVPGYTNVIWSGVTTLELAKKIVEMYKGKIIGLVNLVSFPISKYDLLCMMKDIYNVNVEVYESDKKISDRSMRSIRQDIDYQVPSHIEMLKELKELESKQSKIV